MFDALIDAAFRHKAQQTVRLEPSQGIAAVPSSPVFHGFLCNRVSYSGRYRQRSVRD